jgi:hypothetical protein
MVLSFLQGKDDDVATLIAKKNYSRAMEVIREQLQTQKQDPRLRLQLADVLVFAGKTQQAISILEALADEFAREGFAAKSISVLKKIQKLDPGRRDVQVKLAGLIQEKQRLATAALPPPPSGGGFEIGMEEISIAPTASSEPSAPMEFDSGPSLDIGFGAEPASVPAPAAAAPPPPPPPPPRPAPPPPRPAQPAPVVDQDLITDDFGPGGLVLESEPFTLEQDEPSPAAEPVSPPLVEPEPIPEPIPEPVPEPVPEPIPEPIPEPELELAPEPELMGDLLEPEPEILPELAPEPEVDPMTEAGFADELMSVLEEAFPAGMGTLDSGTSEAAPPSGGSQIVVSPLFKDLAVDELVAVIQGLNLVTFDAASPIITQGEPGDKLYMLTTGTVKAFRKDASGRQAALGELGEGSFFGEVSILTGQPRTASIVATTYCELLELDRPTLDSIVKQHPRVLEVMKQFARERMARR